MAAQILSSLASSSRSRVRVRIFPDCAVGAALRGAHFALLGADRIKVSGEVSNKIGSLSLAAMARSGRQTRVVVVSDVDKIVAPEVEGESEEVEVHPPAEMMGAWAEESREGLGVDLEDGSVEVFGEWFEWYVNLSLFPSAVNIILSRDGHGAERLNCADMVSCLVGCPPNTSTCTLRTVGV